MSSRVARAKKRKILSSKNKRKKVIKLVLFGKPSFSLGLRTCSGNRKKERPYNNAVVIKFV